MCHQNLLYTAATPPLSYLSILTSETWQQTFRVEVQIQNKIEKKKNAWASILFYFCYKWEYFQFSGSFRKMKERTQWQHSGAKLQRTGCTDNPILHSLSAAERLCHLPFQPTERCAALEDTSSESSFVRVDTNQHYTGKCANL